MPRLIIAALLLSLAACKDGPPPAAQAASTPLALKPAVNVAQPRAADPNEALAIRVRRALEDAGRIEAAAIDIVASEGIVSLWGTTGTRDELERAAQVAQGVDGVKSVDNRLVIVRGS